MGKYRKIYFELGEIKSLARNVDYTNDLLGFNKLLKRFIGILKNMHKNYNNYNLEIEHMIKTKKISSIYQSGKGNNINEKFRKIDNNEEKKKELENKFMKIDDDKGNEYFDLEKQKKTYDKKNKALEKKEEILMPENKQYYIPYNNILILEDINNIIYEIYKIIERIKITIILSYEQLKEMRNNIGINKKLKYYDKVIYNLNFIYGDYVYKGFYKDGYMKEYNIFNKYLHLNYIKVFKNEEDKKVGKDINFYNKNNINKKQILIILVFVIILAIIISTLIVNSE
jgi:hypothetical protein